MDRGELLFWDLLSNWYQCAGGIDSNHAPTPSHGTGCAAHTRCRPHLPTDIGLVVGVTLIALNMTMLNKAVEESPASLALPLYQCMNIQAAVVAGGLYFGEFEQLDDSPGRTAGYILGLALSFAGILWLSSAKPESEAVRPEEPVRPTQPTEHAPLKEPRPTEGRAARPWSLNSWCLSAGMCVQQFGSQRRIQTSARKRLAFDDVR